MHDYSVIIKPVAIALVVAIVLGIAVKALEKFLIRRFSKK